MADARKAAFIREFVRAVQQLEAVFDQAPDFEKHYFDLGYNVGGANQITDTDLGGIGLATSDFSAGVTLMQQIKNLAGNAAVTSGDYAATANKFKHAVV